MKILIPYSYIVAIIVFGIIIVFTINRIPQLTRPMQVGVMVVYVIVVFSIGMSQRYPDSPLEVATTVDVENTLINEKPTLLMLYSNY